MGHALSDSLVCSQCTYHSLAGSAGLQRRGGENPGPVTQVSLHSPPVTFYGDLGSDLGYDDLSIRGRNDVKVWVVQNKLQLNDDKTEILLIGSAPGIDLPSSVHVGQSDISFSSAACNLSVIFDSELALKEQVNKLCQLAYLEIRRIGSIRQYFSVEATKTLVSSLVLSRLDYCNALLAGCPQVLLDKIQRVINCSAHLIYKASKSAHITPLLFDLHWLPISSRIQYKIALTCFHIISGIAPTYLSELLHLYSPSRFLRSAPETRIFRVPRVCRRTHGRRSFQYIGPAI